ncbi:MAG: amidohydrolase [Chloroflexia bacterium]|nr:amidohydrolase [Chloroflexia bacterium]
MSIRDLAPDLILTDARITTMADDRPEAGALAIKDGRILAVGDPDDVEALAGPHTWTIRLGGRRVIPGINDTHNHMMSTGAVLNEISLYDARSIEEIKSAVAERVAASPPGAWILGRGWDESLLADRRFPNRHDLDEVAPNNPVVLDRVWNMLLANSAAMMAGDIGRHTPDPPADQLYAGRIERDERGDPTGVFRDRAKGLIQSVVPVRTLAEREMHIRTACRAYNRLGITSVAEPGLVPEWIRAYQNVRRSGNLSVRTSLCLAGWGSSMEPDESVIEGRIADVAVYTGFGDPLLRLDTVKFMPDGGVGDRTALMFEPYLGEPDNCGQFVVSEADLRSRVQWCHDRGWSIDAHTCGDRMQEMVVKAFAAAYDANPDPTIRHRIHHGYFPTETTLELMQRHQIPALATIPFLTNLGESFVSSVGEERASKMMPVQTYLNAGVRVALGSDSPVTTYNPFVGMYSAVTRKTVYGRELGLEEAVSREVALRLYTKDAAWVTFEDDIKGTLEPGKLADIAVLDRDLFSVPDEEMKDISSVLTLLGGEIVHDTLQ